LSFSQGLYTFSNGEVADAEKINENFDNLNQRLTPLEASSLRDYLGVLNFNVDCEGDPKALDAEIKKSAHLDPVGFLITGDCQFDAGMELLGRQVIITGEFGAEVKPKLLLMGGFFQAKNSGIDFSDLDIDGVSLFNLSQNTAVTLSRVNFVNTSFQTRILVRPSSNLRVIDSLQTDARPPITVTAGDLWIRSVSATTKLGDVMAAVGSRIWCRICNVDMPNLVLDTNTSLCASNSYDLSAFTPQHIGVENLTLLAHSIFVHHGAPSSTPPYNTSIENGSLAQWNVAESTQRCFSR